MEAQHISMLSALPLLAHMDEGSRARVARMLEPVPFPQGGSVIIREGDLGETLFFVAEGDAFAEIKGKVVMRYEPGDYFGELSLLTGAQLTRMKPHINDASPHECPLIN